MRRLIPVFLLFAAAVPLMTVSDPLHARVVAVAAVCLGLWLTEVTPPFVPTIILWAAVPLLIAPLDGRFGLGAVLGWAMDPVLVLFFGGFALGIGAQRFGVDRQLIAFALRRSRGSAMVLLAMVLSITAFLSMWLSNIAAAALMFACLRPALERMGTDSSLRRMLLVGVALGADLGGMATPIGTGPNAVAIASLEGEHRISFLAWMSFAVPLTIGMLAAAFVLLWLRGVIDRGRESVDIGAFRISVSGESTKLPGRGIFLAVIGTTVALWLTEPLHGVPAAVTALVATATLFGAGALKKEHLAKIDWSTLILISGGITLGRMLEQSGIVKAFTGAIPFAEMHPTLGLFLICTLAATLAALMSNTASVILLIPIATAMIPNPSTSVLVAISASFGMPFLISTPPNAMAFGEGGVRFGDLFWPGILLMLLGCAVVSVTGPAVLRFAGVP